MNLAPLESQLGLQFPPRHREALLNLADPIHTACDFLLPESPYKGLRLIDVNRLLHDPDSLNRWPDFLIAFASNGCADFFAYDLRRPPLVIYVDPDHTVEENLAAGDRLQFDSFEKWYDWELRPRRKEGANA